LVDEAKLEYDKDYKVEYEKLKKAKECAEEVINKPLIV
jgi:hypothetical protein